MAKLSVYVPDDLLDRARQVDPTIRPSQVLQDALETRVSGGPRPFAVLNEHLREQRALAQAIVNQRATEAYQEGYAVGLRIATSLPWRAFDRFSELHWNLDTWVEEFDEEEYENATATPEEIADGLVVLNFSGLMVGSNDSYIPLRADGSPTGIAAEGFVDAIREVWTGTPTDGPASHAATLRVVDGEAEA